MKSSNLEQVNITNMQVEIISKKTIKPSPPTLPDLKTYKLSFFDQLAPPFPATLVYFYPPDYISADLTSRTTHKSIHQVLQTSLAEVLPQFYPLAGRLTQDGLSVTCQDQGVIYVEAKVNCFFQEFLSRAYENTDLVRNFVPDEIWDCDDLVSRPISGVQVTLFECGGLALAVQNLHTIADGFTGCTYTDEWAKFCKSSEHQVEKFVFGLGSIFPARNVSALLVSPAPRKPRKEIVTIRFLFPETAISHVKKIVEASASAAITRRPSRVEVVTALVWKGLIQMVKVRHGFLRPSMTSLAVNLRDKLGIVQPGKYYFGNLYVDVPIKFDPKINSKIELHDLVGLIQSTLQRSIGECSRASNARELLSIVIKFQNEMREGSAKDEMDIFPATSLCRFPLYEADFGWGKPSWVSRVNPPFPMFTLMDTETGVEARVSLDETDMPLLKADPELAPFT